MNKQNKFVTRWATWFIAPDGYAFVCVTTEDNEDELKSRYERMMKNPDLNGYKFIHVPIAIPIPDEIANKVSKDEDND